MIAKHIAMNAATKSSFARLVRYLTDSQGKAVRTGAIRITNCMNDSADVAALEILNTQAMNTRSRADKTYHLIVSFRHGEQPDVATLSSIEDSLCAALGFAGHQRVSVVHDDTDNLHVHVAINKIHPTRYTILEPFQAYRILARLCDKLEDEYGLQKDNHAPGKTASENRAADMEHHSGVESLLGWVKRECAERMRVTQSWDELHALLLDNGLRLHPAGNGLVITAADRTTVKASSVGREFSRPRLEQRLGPFQAAPSKLKTVRPARGYQKQPLASSVDTTELYSRYRAAQVRAAEGRVRERNQARARKERRIDAAKRTVGLKRAALKLVSIPGPAKKLMYGALSRARSEEIAAIKVLYRRERQAIDQRHWRCQWADWLRHEAAQGDLEALAALRGRDPRSVLTGNSVTGKALPRQPARPTGHDSVTKKGTIIYHVGGSAIRDDGDRLKVSLEADQAAVLSALEMAVARFGGRIAVNGSDGFKEQILVAAVEAGMRVTFADAALEQRRLELTQASTAQQEAMAVRAGPALSCESRCDGEDSVVDIYMAERGKENVDILEVNKQARYTPLPPSVAKNVGTQRVGGQTLGARVGVKAPVPMKAKKRSR
ncbi:TraI/MobA(P) family conjugative relaxase [Massilia niabensis]|uniref:TraI/MobA(P) family conjugative relaxase n=1 Tax=Massilia niabensis TaxID=544910 RepID=A0ABW0L5A9_9BURK